MSYAELHCLSHYSFLRGASHPADLIKTATSLGYQALAITDECSLAGVVKAHAAAQGSNLHLILGSEFKLDGHRLISLVTNQQSYSELSSLITLARRRSEKGEYQIKWSDIQHNLHNSLVIWLPSKYPKNDNQIATKLIKWFSGRLWIGVEHLLSGAESADYRYLYNLATLWEIPMVASGDVHMHCKQRRALQDTLTAIKYNCSVMELGLRRFSNAERYLRPLSYLKKIYPPSLITETLKIAQRCTFCLDELRYEYPKEIVAKHLTPTQQLKHLVGIGIDKRWPRGASPKILKQIEYELKIIAELGYEFYFLTVYDIVDFARNRNILCQGRGSAANSIVCYCLFITEVSPEQVSLLFERFISRERNEPPDIDIDFEHERREEVIQYIYKKYTRERAALAATVITYKPRSAVRDVGKALGLDPLFIEQLSQSMSWWEKSKDLTKRFKEMGLDHNGRLSNYFYSLLQEIIGTPRHLSQHVGGFIITDNPISTLVPVENASMPNRTVIQWDKEDIETLGLLKIDILGLGMLTAIRRCLNLVNECHKNTILSLDSIPKEDKATYDMLCNADSVGVFQVESRAQMAMLPRLKPRCFYDLVIEIAIVRPGPIQGEMVHPYLRRRQGLEKIKYPNSEIKTVLQRTLGVPIFQEQVIKLAMVAAGFSGGEADQLRRSMASWGKNNRLSSFEKKLVTGMQNRGYSLEFAQRLFKQIQGFGVYGFPESHSASFALLAYFSAWLKCHHAAAFYCAILNSQPMGFYSPSQLVQDALRHNIPVRSVDVNHSNWDHSLEENPENSSQPSLRLGYRLIKGMSQNIAQRIMRARKSTSSNMSYFTSIRDFSEKTSISDGFLTLLSSCGAFDSLSEHRREAYWKALETTNQYPILNAINRISSGSLQQDINPLSSNYPEKQLLPPDEIENLYADYNSMGLSLGRHPISILREKFSNLRKCYRHIELSKLGNRSWVSIIGIVTGRQRPGTKSGVIFLTLEDETGNSNIIIWKNVQKEYRQALLKAQLLMVKGTIESDGPVVHIIAKELIDCSELLYRTKIRSRNFH